MKDHDSPIAVSHVEMLLTNQRCSIYLVKPSFIVQEKKKSWVFDK